MSKGSRYYLPTDEGWLDVDCDQYDFPCQLDLEFSKFLTDTEIQTVANSVLPDASLFLRVCLFDSLAALCRSVIVFYQLHGIVLWSLIESSYIVGLDWFITDMIQALIREIVARIDDVFLFLFLKQFNLISFIIFPLYIYIYSFSPFFSFLVTSLPVLYFCWWYWTVRLQRIQDGCTGEYCFFLLHGAVSCVKWRRLLIFLFCNLYSIFFFKI